MGDLSKNFSRKEFASHDGDSNYDTVDIELLWVLQELRDHFNAAIVIVSGHRSPAHNRAVGGAGNSQHLYGRAADIVIAGVTPAAVADYCVANYPRFSVGRYPTFTHIDTRTNGPKYWGSNGLVRSVNDDV